MSPTPDAPEQLDGEMRSLMLALGQRRAKLPAVVQNEIDAQMKVIPARVNALCEAAKRTDEKDDAEYNRRLRELAFTNLNALMRVVEVLLEDVVSKNKKVIHVIN